MATVLTNVGEQFICDKLNDTVATAPEWVAWGTGAGTAAKGDTTLFTEASEARVQGTMSTTGSGSTAKFQVVATITADGTKTITNAGAFTASTSGTLVIKGDHTGVAVDASDQIQYTITLDPS
jgi:hypothetical protein